MCYYIDWYNKTDELSRFISLTLLTSDSEIVGHFFLLQSWHSTWILVLIREIHWWYQQKITILHRLYLIFCVVLKTENHLAIINNLECLQCPEADGPHLLFGHFSSITEQNLLTYNHRLKTINIYISDKNISSYLSTKQGSLAVLPELTIWKREKKIEENN